MIYKTGQHVIYSASETIDRNYYAFREWGPGEERFNEKKYGEILFKLHPELSA